MLVTLNKEELSKIRKSLPEEGYEKISKILNGMSVNSIRMILTEPGRYKKEVIDAAILVIEEYQEEIVVQKSKVGAFNFK